MTATTVHGRYGDCDWRCEEYFAAAHDPASDYAGSRCRCHRADPPGTPSHSEMVTSCSRCECAVWWLDPTNPRHTAPRACAYRYPAPDDGICDRDRQPGSSYCAAHGYEPPKVTPTIDAAFSALAEDTSWR